MANHASLPLSSASPKRITIYFQDDAVRQRSQQAVRQLLLAAAATGDGDVSTSTGTSALLAKKALKYRKVFDRMSDVDVTSPAFDASKFLGVDWCHTPSLKAHCARVQ